MKPFIHIGTLLLTVCVLLSCKNESKKIPANGSGVKTPPPIPKVEAYVVKKSSLSDKLELPGSVVPNETTTINPEISGRLVYLNSGEGKTVSKGTLLAKIYDADLQAQLKKLAVQLKVQEQTALRYAELLRINGVSQQEYDLVLLQANNLRADQAIVRSNIERTEIRAPFTGTLGLKLVSPGAYVTPQTVLTSIRQNSSLKIDFTIPEKYAGEVKTGQLLHFIAEGNPSPYEAKIIATESGISEDNRSLRVRALVVGKDDKLLPGAFIKVNLAFAPDTTSLLVPSQAIIPQARGKKVAVYRAGTVVFSPVETGTRDASMVKITSGVQAGDTLIITGLMGLKPNAKVVIGNIQLPDTHVKD